MLQYTNAKKQIVGELGQDSVFRKRVNSLKHFMKQMSGYGLDKKIVSSLKEKECIKIKILEDGTKLYEIFLEDFIKHGVERDYGHGLQVFCSLKYFTRLN